MKKMLFEVNMEGNNILHVAAYQNNKITLSCFLKHLNKILNREETKNLIKQRGFIQRNIFHFACSNRNEEIFSTLYERSIKTFEKHEIKKMLSEKDAKGWSVLQLATEFCNEKALNDLMKILERHFSNREMKEMKNIYLTIVYMVWKFFSMVRLWFSQVLSRFEERMMKKK